MQTIDRAAIRSRNRVARAGRESATRLESELLNMARAVGHHGVANFIEYVRQRCHASITEAWARDILTRGGYPNPKD